MLHRSDWRLNEAAYVACAWAGIPQPTFTATTRIKGWGNYDFFCHTYDGLAVAMPQLMSHFEGKKLHLLHRIE